MKYKYEFNFMRFVLLLGLLGFFNLQNAHSQGLLNNTTYVINGGNDYSAPVDTFANLTGTITGPSYGALTYLNQYGMNTSQSTTGQVTFLLKSGYNPVEPGIINIGSPSGVGGWPNMYWNQNSPIVLKPDLGQSFTITTSGFISGNQALVRMNAAWYFSIDGDNGSGGRNLTFSMPSNANQTTQRVIDMIPTSGQRCQYLGVKNCVIVGNSSATVANTFAGVYFGGVSAGSVSALARNQNITITGNKIMAVQNGVYYKGLGNAINNQDKNMIISNNIIGDYVNPINPANTAFIGGNNASGIYLSCAEGGIIDNNTIRNTVASCTNFKGIYLSNEAGNFSLDSNIQVTRNTIYNLNNTSSGGVAGIVVYNNFLHNQHLRILIANNSISKLSASNAQSTLISYQYPIGILINDYSPLAGVEVFFNSVNLTGSTLPNNAVAACFVASSTTTGGIIMMNNSFAMKMGRTVANTSGYTTYNVCVLGTTNPFRYCGFNNYYTSTFDGGNAFMGKAGAKDYSALKGWKSFFNRGDSVSRSTIPPFKNDSDLTVATGVSHETFNTGVNLFQFFTFYQSIFDSIRFKVNVDIFGNLRNNLGRFTSIGCHLWNGDSSDNNIPFVGPRTIFINGAAATPPHLLNYGGNFTTLAEALDYLNHYGVGGSGKVTLQLTQGYAGETGYLPAIIDYPGSSIGIPVVIATEPGVSFTLSIPNAQIINNGSIVCFMGARNVYFDGGTNKALTIRMPLLATNPNSRVVGITPVDTASSNVGIMNCNIIGNSTTVAPNTAMGIYVGNFYTPTGAPLVALKPDLSNLSFVGNNIQAVRSGIVVMAPGLSTFTLIKSNIIGGTIAPGGTENTTYIGGVASQAGIFVRGLVDCTIDSNVIRNCVPTTALSNAFSGIQLDEPGSPNFNSINVTRNFVYQLKTTNGTGTNGIRVYLGTTDGNRNIALINNFIGSITGNGAGTAFNSFNPTGIVLDATASTGVTNIGISLAHNTVNLTGTGLGAANSGSAALWIGVNIKGGVASNNNIFGNRINKLSATGKRYAVLIGSLVSPFTTANILPFACNNNNYFVEGNGPVNTIYNIIGAYNNGVTDRVNINDWRAFTTLAPAPAGSDGNSFNWISTFKTDTTPDVNLINGGIVPGGASIVTGICNDIYGNPRFGCSGGSTSVTRWVGAAEVGLPYPALQGNYSYLINGIDNPPTPAAPTPSATNGTFKTVRAAINYLNSQGVDDPGFGGLRTIRLEVASGYVGETDTFFTPITVLDYPRQAPTRPVVLGIAAGRTDTIKVVSAINPGIVANLSVIRLSGCKYFSIDGNSGTGRNLTIMTPPAFNLGSNKVVDIISGINTISSTTPATTNNGIKNCNLIGTSSTTNNFNFAAIYSGGLVTPSNALVGDNDNNTIQNNFIGGVQYGVYLRGSSSRINMDNGNQVISNTIGGSIAPGGPSNTNYFGGITNAAGIYLLAQANITIASNTIKNNIPGYQAPRGIELATIPVLFTALDSFVNINANIINNINSNVGGGAYGIYINFGNDATNINHGIVMSNNMISGITSLGTSSTGTGFALNPYGIFLDATVNMGNNFNMNTDVKMYFNSVNLGAGTNLTAGNSLSAALGMTAQIRSGITAKNNIFQTRLGSATTSTQAYGVAVGGTLNPFVISDNNSYYASITSGTAASMGSNVSTLPVFYNQWFEIMSFTRQDTLSITTQAPFTNDNNLFIPGNISSNLYHAGASIPGYSTDITGTGRFIIPSIGAHEFASNNSYLDNIPPRLFNVTDPTACASGPINVYFNIYDQQLSADTFYYKINGGAVVAMQASFNSGTLRRYTIPAQTAGTLIEFRVSAIDYVSPPNVGAYPTGKIWDTLSTGLTIFPYNNSFEGVNNPIWAVQTLSGGAVWEIGASGSPISPPLGARTGIKTALFRSSTMPAGASARLVSPCLDLSGMTSPTLRFYMSQNSDLPLKRDSIAVTLSAGGNYWTNPLKIVRRVNEDYSLPGWIKVEVCLAQYIASGMRIGIEGFSSGLGQNILIDDITIFDDVQTQTFTPKVFSSCFTDSVRITITNPDVRFDYTVYNLANNQIFNSKPGDGTSMTLGFKAPEVDTVRYYVVASNTTSQSINTGFGGGFITCKNNMPDTSTAYINRFYNGPFVTAGLPFDGSYNTGDGNNPDGAKIGDVITYQFVPPTFYTNANYGTLWSIPSVTAYTSINFIPFTNFTFVAPSGTTPGYVRVTAPANMLDSSIVFNFKFRILASSCDSSFSRVLHIALSPVADFVHTPATNLCAKNDIVFNATTSTKPANNFPFNYGWFFGDGTTAFVENPTKQYDSAGTYQVRFILTDRYGLSSQKVINVTILPSPIVNFSTTIPCAGDSTIFTPTAQPAGSTFLWFMPNFTNQTREVAKYNFPKYDTAYNVGLRITNTSGCYGNIVKNMYVFARPTANFTTSPHCLSSNVPVNNTSSIPTGALGATWYWGNGQNSLGAQPSYKYPASGTYTATLKVSSSFGCEDSMVKTVTVYDRPFVSFNIGNPCVGQGDQTVFNNTTAFAGGAQNLDYVWNFDDNSGNSTLQNPKHAYLGVTSTGAPKRVTLLAVDKINGCRDSAGVNLDLYYKPTAQNAISPPNSICENSLLGVVNSSYTIDQGIFTCDWNWGDGKTDVACNINHTYTDAGLYNIRLIITTINGGCKDTSITSIEVVKAPALTISAMRVDSNIYPYCLNKFEFTASIDDGSYVWDMGDKANTKKYTQVCEHVYNDKGYFTAKVTVIDKNGCTIIQTLTDSVYCGVGIQEQLAQQFNLVAYPNPFANTATIGFELEKAAQIKITVMDMMGRIIKVNEAGKMQSGKHQFNLDESNFGASATYLIKVEIDGESIYKQLMKQ